uniref:Uncharacterized protein n=1 Tax=Anopheles christyi TaxID=43041 RepID=A0A182KGC7_9DIPT
MLTTVGYFGDNDHYLKHRIPMIMGKSYRNLLAHDSLSYNLLTGCWDEKIVINAFIFAHTTHNLFDKRQSEQIKFNFPMPEATYQWIEEQHRLLMAIQDDDVNKAHQMIEAGAEMHDQGGLS